MYFKTVDQMVERAVEMAANKFDYTVSVKDVVFKLDGSGVMLPDNVTGAPFGPFKIEENAHQQLRSKLGTVLFGKNKSLPADYCQALENLNPALLAITYGGISPKSKPSAGWTVRTYQNGDNTVRAVLDKSYGVFDNVDFLQMLQEMMEAEEGLTDYNLVRSSVTRDSTNVKIIFGDKPGHENARYGFGVYLANEETGNGGIQVLPLIQKSTCTNSIIVTQDEFGKDLGVRFIHRGDMRAKRVMVKAQLATALELTEKAYNRLLEAEEERLPNIMDVINGLTLEHRFSRTERDEIIRGTNGKQTVAGLVDGITQAAHVIYGSEDNSNDYGAQSNLVKMEKIGGMTLFDGVAKLQKMGVSREVFERTMNKREPVVVR